MAENLAAIIDHTLLKPEASEADIQKLCLEAKDHQFKSVCINPAWVKYASDLLANTGVAVCTVVGFPLGANTSQIKVQEAQAAIKDGASEIDMVLNIGRLKSEDFAYVYDDIAGVVKACQGQALVKVIIEACLLDKNEKVRACEIAKRAGADFVKTSTGFSIGGATVEDVKLMRATVGPDMGVKASGGIRSLEDAQDMVQAGASRLGASSGVEIISQS
ncbi:Deoxyribose-phosphate aldolase 2 [Alloiococcus otitis]|uniref:Deoxyribose-phosphate aldolase n=1 Tax=Alloiococcus otitis ATCC 51267 TaxID=883081 RepID=K9EEL8_9LACT|nr:deoxyribose-phosphate aldolase [Alloiococcus otitis]EKU94301.1 deoxyribose-phosphate aldolase [Alloiococcus otitis ATCC 51267]SUU81065.1 Deoxyribose-phosphate aldolase 2 [Alloiococcus otitis]